MVLTVNLRIRINNDLVDYINFDLTNKKLEGIFHKPIKGTGLGKLKSIYQKRPEVTVLAIIFYQESRRGYNLYETMNGDIVRMNQNLDINEALDIAKSLLNCNQY
jgi:hypothetical protein